MLLHFGEKRVRGRPRPLFRCRPGGLRESGATAGELAQFSTIFIGVVRRAPCRPSPRSRPYRCYPCSRCRWHLAVLVGPKRSNTMNSLLYTVNAFNLHAFAALVLDFLCMFVHFCMMFVGFQGLILASALPGLSSKVPQQWSGGARLLL